MIFEQCKVGRLFAWAGRDPGIKSPVNSVITNRHSQFVSYRNSRRVQYSTTVEKHVYVCTEFKEFEIDKGIRRRNKTKAILRSLLQKTSSDKRSFVRLQCVCMHISHSFTVQFSAIGACSFHGG